MKIGFIGAGKMGGAIINGLVQSEFIASECVIVSEINQKLADKASKDYKVKAINDNVKLVEDSDVIFLCIKPFVIEEVLTGISNCNLDGKLFISIAAGVQTKKIENILKKVSVIRVMPNTPAFLAKGMSVLSKGFYANNKQLMLAKQMFDMMGKTAIIEESLMDAATGISGSGPAFVYLVIEAMAKGGIELGLDEDTSFMLASQTAIGAAEMVLQTGKTPEKLRSEVTTPGGCTEVGLNVLAYGEVERIFIEAVKATAKKAKELG